VVDPKNFDPASFVDRKTDVCVIPPNSFALARTVEYFRIPRDVLVICLGKSTYARCGIIVNVTPLEPGWEGHVTLEFSNTTPLPAKIYANEGACQFLFLQGQRAVRNQLCRPRGQIHGPARSDAAQIIFDLGVLMLQKHCIEKFGAPAPRVKGRVRAMAGKFSGGTAASLKATMAAAAKDPAVIGYLTNPFSLAGGFEGPAQPAGNKPEYDESLGSWATNFVMAPINTKNVHRTNALTGHLYGTDFVYDEMMLTGPGDAGQQAAEYVAKTPMIGTPDDPKPGEGPTKEERENGFYDVLFVAEYPDGRTARLSVKGDKDPGYGSTSKMISETAIGLSEIDGAGGVTTPGAALGEALVDRLQQHAGLTFTVEG
jgi:hypothetical protein